MAEQVSGTGPAAGSPPAGVDGGGRESPAGDPRNPAAQEPTDQVLNAELKTKLARLEELESSNAKLAAKVEEFRTEKNKQRDQALQQAEAAGEYKKALELRDQQIAEMREQQAETEKLKASNADLLARLTEQGGWITELVKQHIGSLGEAHQKSLRIAYPEFDSLDPFQQARRLESFRALVGAGPVGKPIDGKAASPTLAESERMGEAVKKGDLRGVTRGLLGAGRRT